MRWGFRKRVGGRRAPRACAVGAGLSQRPAWQRQQLGSEWRSIWAHAGDGGTLTLKPHAAARVAPKLEAGLTSRRGPPRQDQLRRQQREVEAAASEARARLLSEERRLEALRSEVAASLDAREARAAAAEAAADARARALQGEARPRAGQRPAVAVSFAAPVCGIVRERAQVLMEAAQSAGAAHVH